ncbi:HEPN domain-containing protein [Agrobacterium rosae]|uniref:HEPN domain-containing protein n=1 Tax=Agrobacterium rosae TaxID=1972867 RepID=UPI000CD8D207|nr:HEPN domain-containing protein [Agrobacterium rosae]POO56160.1 hypothetical protein CTT39_05280 [Agrobacterium rosae]
MADIRDGTLFVGLSGFELSDRSLILPRGMRIQGTFAHLMSPLTVAFARPEGGGPHPGPWKAARGGFGQDITAQLMIPPQADQTFSGRLEVAKTLLFLMRLWSSPEITAPTFSNTAFRDIIDAPDGDATLLAFEHKPRYFLLKSEKPETTVDTLPWVADNFESANRLITTSSEFRLAAYTLDSGQFVENTALVLVSIWGALEAIFSPSKTELSFRVSSLIASYLYPPGVTRRDAQRKIAGLYNKRSAAAHGKPSHGGQDLLESFEILRKVLIKFIRDGEVPTKETLEGNLFGC